MKRRVSVFNRSGTVIASNTEWGHGANPALIASEAAAARALGFGVHDPEEANGNLSTFRRDCTH
jgi:hypothetical protein